MEKEVTSKLLCAGYGSLKGWRTKGSSGAPFLGPGKYFVCHRASYPHVDEKVVS